MNRDYTLGSSSIWLMSLSLFSCSDHVTWPLLACLRRRVSGDKWDLPKPYRGGSNSLPSIHIILCSKQKKDYTRQWIIWQKKMNHKGLHSIGQFLEQPMLCSSPICWERPIPCISSNFSSYSSLIPSLKSFQLNWKRVSLAARGLELNLSFRLFLA